MSSKKKAVAAQKKKSEENHDKNILQAVVLTDSYQTRFRPLTLETPRCLIPLANVPLLEYTLEFLSQAGIEDVFIFVSAHAQKVEEYIRSSKWNKPGSPFKMCRIVMSLSSMSVGDAMRELDAKEMIRTDFLLVNGDFVSNIPLENILAEHRKRRQQNSGAIMTMVLTEAGREHRTKPKSESGVFVIDESNNRCVHYDEIRPHGDSAIMVPAEVLKSHPQLRVRTDLIDCHVDICSVDVPALFTENFDYADIRRHFVHGILTDTELYGKSIHTHIITSSHYAARVQSLQTYEAVSRDVVARWSYPFVPDSNLCEGHRYTYERRNIYKEDGLSLSRTAIVGRNTVLGRSVTVGDNSRITNSIIGDNVVIGDDVVLDRAIIWSDTTISNGTKIQHSIIASHVHIGESCTIAPGCIVSYHVKIPPKTVLEHGRKITSYKKRLSPASTATTPALEKRNPLDEPLSGSEYSHDSDVSDADEATTAIDSRIFSALPTPAFYAHSNSSMSTLPFSDDSDDDSDVSSVSSAERRRRRKAAKTTRPDSSLSTEDPDESWYKECTASLISAFDAETASDVVSLELNGLRMSANTAWSQVRRAVVSALLTRIEAVATGTASKSAKGNVTDTSGAKQPINSAADKTIGLYADIIKRGIHEEVDQVDYLVAAESECRNRAKGGSLLLAFAQTLWNRDLVEEEAVFKWWEIAEKEKGEEAEKGMKVRAPVAAFVKWLREAEEESSDEDDEDEDEDDDEDEDEDDE